MNARRPLWIVVAATFLSLLSLAGWALVFVGLDAPDLAILIVGLWFGASALASGIGLWRMRRWVLVALPSCGVATIPIIWGLTQFAVGGRPSLASAIQGDLLPLLLISLIWIAARRRLQSRQ